MPLRSILVVPFVLQISIAVGLTGWLSFRNGKLAVNDLADQLMQEIGDRITQQADSYLETPHEITRLNARSIQANILHLDNFRETGHYFWEQVQVSAIDYVAFGAANGEYIGAGYVSQQDPVIDEVSITRTNGDLHSYATDQRGNRIRIVQTIKDWDHRLEVGYTDIVQANKRIWSRIYQWDDGSGTLSISAGRPVYSATGEFRGVLSADLRLTTLSKFLRSLKIGKHGKAFILERNGFLVASSSDEPLTVGQGEKTERLLATQSSDPLIQNTAKYLLDQFGDFATLQPITQLNVTLDGEQEFVRVVRFTDELGLDWLIVVVVPETDFMARIHANTYTTVLLCLIAFIAATAIGLATSRYLIQPILRMIGVAEALSEGRWEQQVPESRVQEIESLAKAFNSMAEQLQDSFKKLHYSAYHDVLTSLMNRAAFIEHLEEAILQQQHTQYLFGVLFLDLDSFKLVNDSLGHIIGDELLIAVSSRIQDCLPKNALAARLGGDEFIILVQDIVDPNEATSVAEKISKVLTQPFNLRGYEIFTSASIGIVLSTEQRTSSESYLRDADIAMYHAKSQGKARYEVFNTLMHTQSKERLQLETDLRHAIEKGRFEIYYQPIVSSETRTIVGFEALVRWHHPTKGMISPNQFIPIAEETGLIVQLGQWVLSEACHQLSLWQLRYPEICSLFISVNLSVRQLLQPDLLEQITQILQVTRLEPSALKLEVTESTLINNIEVAGSKLESLRAEGIQISIDDFGTGYSSLSQLHNLPISVLKIDRSFVCQMMQDEGCFEITKTVILLARGLGIDVVAEGVETQEQFEQLQRLGCRYLQGYLFSPALPAAEIEKLVYSQFPKPFFEYS